MTDSGFHERFDREEKIAPGSDKSFCIAFACFFLLVAFLSHKHRAAWLAMAACFALAAALRPHLAAPLNRAWSRLGLFLARITNPVLLTALYAIAIVPLGILMQVLGKTTQSQSPDPAAESYWIHRTPPGPAPQSMTDQF